MPAEKEYFRIAGAQWDDIEKGNDDLEAGLLGSATRNADAVRKSGKVYGNRTLRSNYAVDIDRIQHCMLFNRGTDKTQVFSFYHNDDITRRSTHVQLVSRIARTIGRVLRLNLDLIEAIAIGHDIGHTPFGHKGEDFLSEIYKGYTGRSFNHNVHGVRILQTLTQQDLTLQTLDGILCHNGEKAFQEYKPAPVLSFVAFEALVERCYTHPEEIKKLKPCTLEGCVVRVSDMIAYLGKDRQDAGKLRILHAAEYTNSFLGTTNSSIINNLIRNVIKNSLNQPYISLDEEVTAEMKNLLAENDGLIYNSAAMQEPYYTVVKPMMIKMYERFLEDYKGDFESPLYKHHINNPAIRKVYTNTEGTKIVASRHDIIVDYIASMTDDYFLEVFQKLFPDDPLNRQKHYIGYFDPQ